MKPQSAAFLEKAQALLGEAETMLKVDLNSAAGRTAYLAGFHPAQAQSKMQSGPTRIVIASGAKQSRGTQGA